ncbi:protein RDM1-like [Primulina huaijiensis]|uniref:protein RDM1-like n=1 Tax=Primulina huaijiensis TaxID=1492673 RepID=UPI003CC70CC3
MKGPLPSNDQVDISFDDSSSSHEKNDSVQSVAVDGTNAWNCNAEMQFRLAKSYKEYMKLIPIPVEHVTAIPFISWKGLGNSIKQIYGQHLHYLAYLLLKQLDNVRIGAKDENVPLGDMIINPYKAEFSIWIIEEILRCTRSPYYLTKLWENDPSHHALIDAVFPKL